MGLDLWGHPEAKCTNSPQRPFQHLLLGREVPPGAVNLHGLRSGPRQRVCTGALDTKLEMGDSLFPFQAMVLVSNAELDVG